jgi:hypothetical protein
MGYITMAFFLPIFLPEIILGLFVGDGFIVNSRKALRRL